MRSHFERRRVWIRFLLASVIMLLGRVATADVISNHGGPVLGASGKPFTIYPYYYGSGWGSATSPAVVEEQLFLTNLAAYISGKNVPAGVNTFLHQYGVVAGASVAAPYVNATPTATTLSNQNILDAISAAQGGTNPKLPQYAANVLILFMPATGFSPCTTCGDGTWWGYHRAAAANKYYAVTFADAGCTGGGTLCFSLVTSHEVFESATDPGFSVNYAWDNFGPPNVEVCDNAPDSGFRYMGSAFPGCWDNSLSGKATTTGYDPPTPFEPASFIVPATSAMW
jgi:hypothetical protein